MSPTVRLLPFAAADGATNMAADEALLEAAAAGTASLRYYTWTEPTVSLGYFQPAAGRAAPPLDRLAWVRRATGGAALVHHHELTYALALPAGPPWHGPEPWGCRFHHLIQAVLAEHGVRAHAVVCGEERLLGGVLCFLHQTPGDLAVNGSKVAGSARRKMRGAVLQHGSVLLRRSEFAPHLPGVNDAGGDFTPEELAARLVERFAADTGWRVEPGGWTTAERERVAQIRAEKYANPAWNGKR
ncbi:MAG: lipoate--protein ligase family protein [Gemmataceae bacterium]|nr:lipoate--protein ligase family protein [Gemmataceae bacterium]